MRTTHPYKAQEKLCTFGRSLLHQDLAQTITFSDATLHLPVFHPHRADIITALLGSQKSLGEYASIPWSSTHTAAQIWSENRAKTRKINKVELVFSMLSSWQLFADSDRKVEAINIVDIKINVRVLDWN